MMAPAPAEGPQILSWRRGKDLAITYRSHPESTSYDIAGIPFVQRKVLEIPKSYRWDPRWNQKGTHFLMRSEVGGQRSGGFEKIANFRPRALARAPVGRGPKVKSCKKL